MVQSVQLYEEKTGREEKERSFELRTERDREREKAVFGFIWVFVKC